MKKTTNNKINSLLVNLQVVLTIIVLIMFVIFIFERSIWVYLQLLLGVSLLLMSYNNYVIYKRRVVTVIFCISGIILIILGISSL